MHLPQVGENPALDNPPLSQGFAKILEKSRAHLGLFDFSDQVDVGATIEKLEGAHIFYNGLALEVAGIGLDGVQQAGGQLYGRLDFGGPQVFGHNRSRRPVLGPNVAEGGLGAALRVVIDDDCWFKLAEGLVVAGLGIDDNHFVGAVLVDVLHAHKGNAQKPDHGQVVRPFDRVDVGD